MRGVAVTCSAKPTTYVKVAQRLLKRSTTVSAGQVAWHAHRKTSNVAAHDFAADRALADSGLFERANFINGNTMGITTWKSRSAVVRQSVSP